MRKTTGCQGGVQLPILWPLVTDVLLGIRVRNPGLCRPLLSAGKLLLTQHLTGAGFRSRNFDLKEKVDGKEKLRRLENLSYDIAVVL